MGIKHLLLATSLLLLGGCATLSQEQCSTGDWYGIGFSDGTRGRALTRIEDHQEACADYGVAPQIDLYRQGRDEGLLQYCTAANGFRVGSHGNSYTGVCSGYGESDFLRGYQAGKPIYQQRQRVNRVENSLRRIDREMNDLDQEEAKLRKQLVADGLKKKQRKKLLHRLDELDWRHNELLREHDSLHLQLGPEKRYLQELRSSGW